MDPEVKSQILNYADDAFRAAYNKSLLETDAKVQQLKNHLASRGALLTGATVVEIAKLEAEHINTIVQAKADALLDAYELYGAGIDDAIFQAASDVRWSFIAGISRNANVLLPPGVPAAGMFEGLLVQHTGAVLDTVKCEIARRKIVPKLKPSPAVVQHVHHVYHLHGDNSRVNIHSTDNSINVVNVTANELFRQLRTAITENVSPESQSLISERLDALENAQHTKSFAQRYTEFVAVAADHWTLLSPFIPALTELLHKAL